MKYKHFIVNFLSCKNQFIILVIVWSLLQFLAFYQFGIVASFEATKYIEQAQLLTDAGSYSSYNFLFYSTEILLIALCTKLNVNLGAVVLVQLVSNALSLFFFYKLVYRLTGQSIFAFIITLFFLSMFYYHLYNVHLFTESLFFSFSIFFTYYLFTIQKLTLKTLSLLFLFLTTLIFTRPTGMFFFPATIFFLIVRFGKKKFLPILFSIAGGLFLFYILLNKALDSGGELDFLLPYIEEHVICGVPTIQKAHTIVMPVNKNSVEGLWYIIKNNDELFLRLAKQRFIAFWGMYRPFYSTIHNLFIVAYFFIIYFLILFGIRKMLSYNLPQAIFMLTYISLVLLTVLLSCDEWHNRFMFSILPFLLLLGIGSFIKNTPEKNSI